MKRIAILLAILTPFITKAVVSAAVSNRAAMGVYGIGGEMIIPIALLICVYKLYNYKPKRRRGNHAK